MHLLDRSCVIVGNFLKYCVPQQVSLVVVAPIDLEVHRRSMTFNKLGKDSRAVQYVDVIVSSWHTKEGVPNLEVMCRHRLKYDTATAFGTFVHPLPRKWVVLPFPMHAVDA